MTSELIATAVVLVVPVPLPFLLLTLAALLLAVLAWRLVLAAAVLLAGAWLLVSVGAAGLVTLLALAVFAAALPPCLTSGSRTVRLHRQEVA
ncbi:hypothetical protein [Saccharothrix coeruleofusca]|uniref:Uncharacterized protein n=1 Tax=Saccharothrix coeruleofusca TaxID=33919 RepID=A0A918AJU5_9PSEU|nr:hypothetical protein [Saccharothrix coeruleofusca]GGP35977.1 hypothetical protein GCM10010185_03720 [Saccharothrix coeruleofusca]